jgi:hypothetical protein
MIVSLIGGIAGVIVKRRLEAKITSLNMALRSLLMFILLCNHFNWDINLSIYFIFMYLFNQFFFEIDVCQEYGIEEKIKLNIGEKNRLQLKITFIETIIGLCLWGILLWKISSEIDNRNIFYAAGTIILSICLYLNQIYNKFIKISFLTNKQQIFIISVITCTAIMAVSLHALKAKSIDILIFSVSILVITMLPWYKIINKIYEKTENLPKQRNFKLRVLLQPLAYMSKMFWLFLDIFLSEKVVTTSLNFISQQSTILFFKLSKKRRIINILCITVGCLIFIISFLKGGR